MKVSTGWSNSPSPSGKKRSEGKHFRRKDEIFEKKSGFSTKIFRLVCQNCFRSVPENVFKKSFFEKKLNFIEVFGPYAGISRQSCQNAFNVSRETFCGNHVLRKNLYFIFQCILVNNILICQNCNLRKQGKVLSKTIFPESSGFLQNYRKKPENLFQVCQKSSQLARIM